MSESVKFHSDGTATVRLNGILYLVHKPKITVRLQTRYFRGHAIRQVARYLTGLGLLTNLDERAHAAMKKHGQAILTRLTVLLEVLSFQNVLDLAHKILYTILPDQFVFRFKLGGLLDIALGGWAGAV